MENNNNDLREAFRKIAEEERDNKKDPKRSQKKDNLAGCVGAGIIAFIIVGIAIYFFFKWLDTLPTW